MKNLKKIVALATAVAMFGSTAAYAQPYAESAGGYGYQESRRSPYIAPAVALGTIALVAIIAVAVQNGSRSHGHSHD